MGDDGGGHGVHRAAARWAIVAVAASAGPAALVAQATGPEVVQLPDVDRTAPLELEHLYDVGTLGGEPWSEFQELSAAAFGPDGRLYLLDTPSARIVAVGLDGALLHVIDRAGDGPGEYRTPTGIAALPDGGVVVMDFGERAFVVYDAAGARGRDVRPDLTPGVPEADMVAASDGTVIAFPARIVTGSGHAYFTAAGIRSASEEGLPLLRIPVEDDAPTRVLARATLPQGEGPGRTPVRRAFEPLPSWGPLAEGHVALHRSVEYRIEILGPSGTVERVLTRSLPPRSTTAADRRAYEEAQEEEGAGRVITFGGGRARAGSPPPEVWFHPVISPVQAVTADGQNRVWVQRPDPENPTRPGPVDILAADGAYVGTVAPGGPGLPDAFGPDGLVVFLEHGALGVPVARVYRLRSESRFQP